MSKLKDLIGEEKWQQLQRKYPHMDELLYHVVCETCGKTFYETTLSAVQDMLLSGEWDVYLPQLWYVTAGRHWVSAKFHSIRIYVDDGHGDKTLVKDLSAEWAAQISEQKKKVKGFDFEQALLKNLDYLEQQILKRQRKLTP